MIKRIGFLFFFLILPYVCSAEGGSGGLGGRECVEPRQTTLIAITVNLQADAEVLPGFSPDDPSGTSNYSSSVTAYDRFGQSHVVNVYFRKVSEGVWDWYAVAPDSTTTPNSGTINFTTTGLLQAGSGAPTSIALTLQGTVQNLWLAFDGSLGGDSSTQYPMPFATIFVHQDGFPATCPVLDSPRGGEAWVGSSTHEITWRATPEVQDGWILYWVLYSLDKGATWEYISTDPVTTTSIEWDLPSVTKRNKKCLVKLVTYRVYPQPSDEIVLDMSDQPFTIDVAEITNPSQGETLVVTDNYTITWTSSVGVEPVHEVKLYYSINKGNSWKKIDTITGNPGAYLWTVPQPKKFSTKCKVRVVLLNDKGRIVGKTVSQGYFTIQP